MRYDEAIRYLARLVNYEQVSPAFQDLGLDAIRALLQRLGNPHERLFVIHVAGTKGKGSVAAMLESILRQAGYRTGLYTSPQLESIEDRIRIDGVPITQAALAAAVSEAVAARSRPAPTFFDVMTALAFMRFASERVDVAIVEVGMGGRTDSTNICAPKLAIIASVGFDHMAQLGGTLGLIAAEKAGIIKPGCPVVSGVIAREARLVVEAACERQGCALRQSGRDFSFRHEPGTVSNGAETPAQVQVATRARTWPAMGSALLGEHQAANAAVAVAAVEQLQAVGLAISDEAVRAGLAQVRWPARVEVVRGSPLVVLDCSHNPASAQALADTMRESLPDHFGPRRREGARRFLLFASSRDKELAAILAILAPLFHHAYLTRYSDSRRSATAEALAAALGSVAGAPPSTFFGHPAQALEAVLAEAGADDLVCATGSVFLAGELRPLLGMRQRGGA